jgi:ketosteroid isomerase-like protein
MRTLLSGGALGVLVVSLAACASSSASSDTEQALQRKADSWEIDQIEKNFHKAISRKDIDVMMRLWAPNATFTYGPGETATGKQQIRQAWLKESKNFRPTYHRVSETLPYKVRITVNGDRGTLYFECHYIDLKTHKLGPITASDMDVARINGRWLITNMVGASATLSP